MCLRRGRDWETGKEGRDYFYLEEVLWWAVDLFEALLARIRHGLHGGQWF